MEVGGGSGRVKLGVLARWVARGVNERRVQAYSLLQGVLAIAVAQREGFTYDLAGVTNRHVGGVD